MFLHLLFEPSRKWKARAVVYLAQCKSNTGCVHLCVCEESSTYYYAQFLFLNQVTVQLIQQINLCPLFSSLF